MAVREEGVVRQPLIMGVINATPDSFHSESRNGSVNRAKEMLEQGAFWIDIGGESTRPGADDISIEEELKRTIPLVEEISKLGKGGTFADLKTIDEKLRLPRGTSFEMEGYADYLAFEVDED